MYTKSLVVIVTLIGIISSNLSFAAVSDILSSTNRLKIKARTVKGHTPLTNYTEARVHLMTRVHIKKERDGFFVRDVYCGKIFKLKNENTLPNHEILNTEHTWPQSRFSKRASAAEQKSDLHHLYPTDSKANGMRGNLLFTETKNSSPIFSGCPEAKLGKIAETGGMGFEPPEDHKGNVARSLFYFSIRYDIEIPDAEEVILRQWHNADPIDEEEFRRNNAVEKIQGNRNPFIDEPQLVDLIANF